MATHVDLRQTERERIGYASFAGVVAGTYRRPLLPVFPLG
jgi:hypothetical protein